MSAFSGGSSFTLFFLSKAPACARQTYAIPLRLRVLPKTQCRYISTTLATLKASPLKAKPQGRVVAASKATPTTTAQVESFTQSLIKNGSGTILYEGPTARWVTISSYAAGLFCITYAGLNLYWNYAHPPPGLAWWVPHAYAVICVFMAGMGTYFILTPAHVIRSVKAVPAKIVKAGTASVAKAAPSSTPLHLEVQIRRALPIPGLGPIKLSVKPEEFVYAIPLFAPAARQPTASQLVAQRREETERQKAAREYEMDHLMTAPFRHMKQGASTVFGSIRRGFTREGYAPVLVNGTKYKMDIQGGWALQGGKALDRIARVNPAAF